MSIIKDINLAPSGEMKINWVERNMPVLRGIGRRFSEEKPFKGLKVALSVHLEAKTAYLCRVMEMGGAEMYVTGSNPLSTQDDVAAALAAGGMNVFAEYGCTEQQYEDCLREVLKIGPNIIIDDGGDLVHLMHEEFADLIPGVIGGCEETTTGINRLRIMSAAGALRFPMVMVNDADCKHMFDNRYGTARAFGTVSAARQILSSPANTLSYPATAGAARASRSEQRDWAQRSSLLKPTPSARLKP